MYTIWALHRGQYPYKINVFVCRGQIFEAEGEVKFSPVYRHIVVLLVQEGEEERGIWGLGGELAALAAVRKGRQYIKFG